MIGPGTVWTDGPKCGSLDNAGGSHGVGGPGLSLQGESAFSRKDWSELGGHLLWAVPATAHSGARKAWSLEPSGSGASTG